MDILTQLNNAMTYIEVNIDDDLALSNVSGATTYSPYHFGRLFYYIADMPLSDYIRKRKLSLAAMKLQNGGEKVIDLAILYGYDSADSFSRAFTKQHGVTPSAARKTGVNLTIFPPLTFQIKIKGVQAMNWRIEEKEAFEVFGIERIFESDGSDGINKVPEFWAELQQNGNYDKLMVAGGGGRNPNGNESHFGPLTERSCIVNAVCFHPEPGEKAFPYMLCAVKTEKSKTDGYKTATVPKLTWAIFREDGMIDHSDCQIPKLFGRAYSEWLPSSGYEKADGPDMEIYGDGFEEVWIPVKK